MSNNIHPLRTHNPLAGSRLLPAGCDQQQRHDTRMHRIVQWQDTVPAGLDEAAPEGGQHRELTRGSSGRRPPDQPGRGDGPQSAAAGINNHSPSRSATRRPDRVARTNTNPPQTRPT